MVSVFFEYDHNANLYVDTYFNNVYNPDWFLDDFVKEMVLDVDNSVVQDRYCIMSPAMGQIPPMLLSGGVKGLILLYKTDDFYTDLQIFGENCEKWLSKIFKIKDVKCCCSSFDLTFRGYEINGICENNGKLITNAEEWTMMQYRLAGEPENER